MATIDLGRIKFKWQGAWSSSTAYVVDDVVESGGNTYVCIAASTNNVPPNATYWELMAQKGTDTSVATTQGDIIYHNGTSLARLGAGTNGQLLQTGGSGANPSWTDAPSGKVKQIVTGVNSSGATSSSVTTSGYSGSSIPNNVGVAHVTLNITPTSSSSKLICMANAPSGTGGNGTGLVTITVDQVAISAVSTNGYSADASGVNLTGWIQNSSTSQRTVEFRTVGEWTGNAVTLGQIRNGHTTSFNGHYGSLIVMEVE